MLHVSHSALKLSPVRQITALNLDGQRISKLINLERLENLRWASFKDNDISKVDGLDRCLKLEELCLDDNSVTTLAGQSRAQRRFVLLELQTNPVGPSALAVRRASIGRCLEASVCTSPQNLSLSLSGSSGLSGLRCLNRLSVDRNQLSSLEPLPNLSFLSVESNCVNSLRGIEGFLSLRELYAANNQISTSRDIYCLKVSVRQTQKELPSMFRSLSELLCPPSRQGLTNIIILDLYGNPLLEKLESYRIYVVFHVPSLKALDGQAVVQYVLYHASFVSNIVNVCKVLFLPTRRRLRAKVQNIHLEED